MAASVAWTALQLGAECFVLDGNHHVSVARHQGVVALNGPVTEYLSFRVR